MTLYETLKQAGIEIDNHESDLYFPKTEETIYILSRFSMDQSVATQFVNQLTSEIWYCVPFAYIPWWENKYSS